MSPQIQLGLKGGPACDDLRSALQLIEVEENADRPDTLLMRLPVNRTSSGDLQFVGDGTLEPSANVTVVVAQAGQASQCIFDGYVLSWRLHLDRTSSASTIDVWAQDASWLMSTSDTVQEWCGMTDAQVANAIFVRHGITPAHANTNPDDTVRHDPEGHTLFQRATDLQFARGLARRNGKLMRVACTSTPGARTGYFVTPDVGATSVATINLVDPDAWNVDSLEFDWDVLRPTEVDASQVDLWSSSNDAVAANATSSGLPPLDTGDRDYPTYVGSGETAAGTLVLTPTADVSELNARSRATLREAQWFVCCRGETTVDRLGTILRVGSVVMIEGAGRLHSGKWFVWNVLHRITVDQVSLRFTLVRNAVGPAL